MRQLISASLHASWRLVYLLLAWMPTRHASSALAGEWRQLGIDNWRGASRLEVAGLEGEWTAVIAHPAGEAQALTVGGGDLPPGLYEARITLRPSHAGDAIAFHGGVRVDAGGEPVAAFPGYFFARSHQPESRTFRILHERGGPLAFRIEAFGDADTIQRIRTQHHLERGGPSIGADLDLRPGAAATARIDDLDVLFALDPEKAVYYLVDDVALRPVSRGGYVVKVTRDKIRYNPGDTLRGGVVVAAAGGRGGEGVVNLYLERGVRERTLVKTLPITLAAEPQTLEFAFALPERELGYAVVAEYVSDDGVDRHEAAEYFTIAENFNRVYIAGGGGGGHGATKADEATMRRWMEAARDSYGNVAEHFAWAEEDMVEMSPETDYWFSGQTQYHIRKAGLQRMIRLAHEHGIAQVSYAKFIMSGYLGYRTAYDYPSDHRGQYHYPVGMWEGVSVKTLDRLRNREFIIYENTPGRIGDNPFYVFWQSFLPINPDATARMTRIAAEEVVRSAEMFGWDGIRWDGHPRGGGQCGGPGVYDARAARRTESLVRYFKDIVGQQYPNFGHGYNYLLVQKNPTYDWAYEDFELDELCRGGGLIMNESIGNATAGWSFALIARNLQVEGDLVRERGGYYLGITGVGGQNTRDALVESALWAAAGARPYTGAATTLAMRRYLTRFAEFTLDENLRRLATPEKVLQPQGDTRLWWDGFVYETPLEAGRRRLVVNFLNLPLDDSRINPEARNPPDRVRLAPGTDPVVFALTLPDGFRAVGAHLVDPQTLEVTPLPLPGGRFEIPPIAYWRVAVIDLEVADNAPALADLYGPPRTFGVPRPARQEDPPPSVVLDPQQEVWEVNRDLSALAPASVFRGEAEQAALEALPLAERQARLLEIRERNPAENFIAGWWRGGSLPADLKLKDKPPAFGDLTPRRNGRFDIFHGRGAMDYRLRLPETFARLDRFAVHDAPLAGLFRAGGGHYLVNGIPAARLPEFDLLLYTAIPHCAMGVENSYALVDYVKAGGAVFFTGGEYAFGKGGYMHTVLERELLPVLCTETVDTRYSEVPLPFEPGPEWKELGVDLDLAAKPSFWVWNQVALKDDPGVKVFLKSGNRPVLVGWQIGQGRVAALLVDHRGKSTADSTAFFDWDEWPALLEAVYRWLAPEATSVDPPPPALSAPELAALTNRLTQALEGEAMEDLLDDALAAPANDWAGLLGGAKDAATGTRGLTGEALKRRVALLNQALALKPDPALSAALADQLATVGNLPQALRWRLIDAVHAAPPPDFLARIQNLLRSTEPAIRQNGYQLAAAVGAPAFAAETQRGPDVGETDAGGRRRALILGLPLYAAPDLVDVGSARVAEWNALEAQRKHAYTGGKGFSLAAPEGPLLDKETLFERVAWLAYLSRYDAQTHSAQFAREWLQLAQYREYCDRSIGNLWADEQMSAATKHGRSEDFQRLRAALERLATLTRPDLERLSADHPERVADGFRQAHFTEEFRAAMNVLGHQDRVASAAFVRLLKDSTNPHLADFAAARAGP